jgi:hypothetical protein
MMHPRLLVVLAFLLLPFSSALWSVDEQEVEVIPNPHDAACQSRRLDGFLEPAHLLIKPLPTQKDTFQELVYHNVLTVPVPVYRMKQPERISSSELQFQLILVKDLAKSGKALIHESPVEPEKAMDSWFLGYYWTPLLMSCGDESWQHVGWKFTALRPDQSESLNEFYALMVQIDEQESVQGIRIGGFKAAGWMVTAIMS